MPVASICQSEDRKAPGREVILNADHSQTHGRSQLDSTTCSFCRVLMSTTGSGSTGFTLGLDASVAEYLTSQTVAVVSLRYPMSDLILISILLGLAGTTWVVRRLIARVSSARNIDGPPSASFLTGGLVSHSVTLDLSSNLCR